MLVAKGGSINGSFDLFDFKQTTTTTTSSRNGRFYLISNQYSAVGWLVFYRPGRLTRAPRPSLCPFPVFKIIISTSSTKSSTDYVSQSSPKKDLCDSTYVYSGPVRPSCRRNPFGRHRKDWGWGNDRNWCSGTGWQDIQPSMDWTAWLGPIGDGSPSQSIESTSLSWSPASCLVVNHNFLTLTEDFPSRQLVSDQSIIKKLFCDWYLLDGGVDWSLTWLFHSPSLSLKLTSCQRRRRHFNRKGKMPIIFSFLSSFY